MQQALGLAAHLRQALDKSPMSACCRQPCEDGLLVKQFLAELADLGFDIVPHSCLHAFVSATRSWANSASKKSINCSSSAQSPASIGASVFNRPIVLLMSSNQSSRGFPCSSNRARASSAASSTCV